MLIRRVSGNSMLPALRPGQIVLGWRWFRRIRPGDIIIIRHGGREKVKRAMLVSSKRLFVMGDNQEHSTDSRSFGWLPASAVKARVIWPRTARRLPEGLQD